MRFYGFSVEPPTPPVWTRTSRTKNSNTAYRKHFTCTYNVNFLLYCMYQKYVGKEFDLTVDQPTVVPGAHEQVEMGTVLEREHEADEVVVDGVVGADEQCSLEVHPGELGRTNRYPRRTV